MFTYTYYVARQDHTGRVREVEDTESTDLDATMRLRDRLRGEYVRTFLNPNPAWYIQRRDESGRFAGTMSIDAQGEVRW